jgi:MerR family regulatory protein
VSGGLRSGALAAAAGANVQTLRYYERRGLLDEPDPHSGRAPGVRAGDGDGLAGYQGGAAARIHP